MNQLFILGTGPVHILNQKYLPNENFRRIKDFLMRYKLNILMFFFGVMTASAQDTTRITLLQDGDRGTNEFIQLVVNEIDALLAQDYTLDYNVLRLDQSKLSVNQALDQVLADDSEIVISVGFESSGALSQRSNYPKPCIAGFSIQRIDAESTGINNYTFIQSPFSIQQDFETFQSIYPFKNLGIFIPPPLQSNIEPYLKLFAGDFKMQFIPITNDPKSDVEKLGPEVDAIYLLPNLYNEVERNKEIIEAVNARKLPSFSLIGRRDVELGALASISPSDYLGVYARRIALNVMKILEGQNAKDLPVQISGIENDFVINVATMESIEIYPPFEVLSQASFINLEPQLGRKYSLRSAVAEALSNNLNYSAAKQNVEIQKTEIGIAKSNLLPNLSLNSTVSTLDGSTADLLMASNQLTPQTSWTGNLGLTQLIFSQPAWANVAIQKELLRSEEAGLMSQQLDLVQDVCVAYLNLLQAQANLNIQNSNIKTTLSNLNIAKTKAKIGTVSNADVYGFESQLAQNRTLLNDARTTVEQARIAFNQLLNKPLDEDFVLEDVKDKNNLLFIQEERIFEHVNNHYDFRKFAEFLIDYAYENAPEIEQIEWAIRAQKTSLKSNQLSRFLPQVAMQGNIDKNLGRYGTRTPDATFEMLGIDPYQPTWNVGVNASLPLFQGFVRNKRIQQDKIRIDQLETNRDLVRQSFATNIRISLENLGNSYNDIQFTQQAKESSDKYLGIVQDLYREGAINIVTLLDAQNNALRASLGAISSQYQFIIDAIIIERLFNNIYLLKSDDEKEEFINAYLNYLINNG